MLTVVYHIQMNVTWYILICCMQVLVICKPTEFGFASTGSTLYNSW